jgi:hypothetical protein
MERFRHISPHCSVSGYRAGWSLLGLASSLTFTCQRGSLAMFATSAAPLFAPMRARCAKIEFVSVTYFFIVPVGFHNRRS